MLRPTQSAIIFVQQLGRGLRKVPNKSFLTVIDFIGNYSNNYMIPIALFGDTSYNHDTLRKLINSGSACIPGASTIDFDFIARERIFTAINNASFNQQKLLIEEYNKVKNRLGRIPRLIEYLENDSIDPTLFIEKYGSYPLFLMKAETDYQLNLSPAHLKSLEFISNEIASGIRPHELVMIEQLINKGSFTLQNIKHILEKDWKTEIDDASFNSAVNILADKFFKEADRKKFGNIKYLSSNESLNQFTITDEFTSLCQSKEYKDQLMQAIDFGLSKYRMLAESGKAEKGLILYAKYSRKDVCKLLNWENEKASTIYGYRVQYNTTPWTCPIFVKYVKSEDIKDSIKYDDIFIDNTTFNWMTRNRVKVDSKETVAIMDWKANHIRLPLFVKKSDGEGRDFYYMGDVEPIKAEQQTIKSDGKDLPIVNILFHLRNAVRQDLFGYFENIRA